MARHIYYYYFGTYSFGSSDGKVWKDLEKRKNEEIAQLQEELTRRKGWIMEVEKQREEAAGIEAKTVAELRETRKELEAEKKKSDALDKSSKALEQKLKGDLSAAQQQIDEVKTQRDKFHKQHEALLVQHENLDKEQQNLREMYNAEAYARRQLEESSNGMQSEIQRLGQRFETETSQLGEMVNQEKKSKEQFISETQNVGSPPFTLLSTLDC